ncbi:MAG: hypothetical protein ACRDQB_16650, partial [Thermocrispum sp.]
PKEATGEQATDKKTSKPEPKPKPQPEPEPEPEPVTIQLEGTLEACGGWCLPDTSGTVWTLNLSALPAAQQPLVAGSTVRASGIAGANLVALIDTLTVIAPPPEPADEPADKDTAETKETGETPSADESADPQTGG